MSAELVVGVIVTAFAHKMKIELGQQIREGVRIIKLEGLAGAPATLNLVAAGRRGVRLAGWPGGFKKAFGAERDGIGDLCGGKSCAFNDRRAKRDGGLNGSGEEKSHHPSGGYGMGAEDGRRIGVASSEYGIDLLVQARRVVSARMDRMRCGDTLFGQVHPLKDESGPAMFLTHEFAGSLRLLNSNR